MTEKIIDMRYQLALKELEAKELLAEKLLLCDSKTLGEKEAFAITDKKVKSINREVLALKRDLDRLMFCD